MLGKKLALKYTKDKQILVEISNEKTLIFKLMGETKGESNIDKMG